MTIGDRLFKLLPTRNACVPDGTAGPVGGKVVLEEHLAEVCAAPEDAGAIDAAVVVLGLHQHKVTQLLPHADKIR